MSRKAGSVVDRESMPWRPCVGIMLVNPSGLVWVGQRLGAEGESWQMPQGGIDKGETPRAAALRELHEETGADSVQIIGKISDWLFYDLPDDLLGQGLKGRYRGQKQKWFAMRFTGADDEFNLMAEGSPEFSDWRWQEAAALPDLVVSFKRDVYRRVVKEFSSFTAPD